jgi:cytochrome b subunit of formate dehydrogenase
MNGDTIFRLAAIGGFAVLAVAMAAHYVLRARPALAKAGPLRGGPPLVRRYGAIERLVLWGLSGSILVLMASGIGLAIVGRELAGLALMLHVTVGGAMAFFAAAAAVLWCAECSTPGGRFDAGVRTTYWLMLVLSLPVVLTVMFSMLPLLGPEGLETLNEIHRYSSLLLGLVAVVHFYHAVVARRGSLRTLVTGNVTRAWAERYSPPALAAGETKQDTAREKSACVE